MSDYKKDIELSVLIAKKVEEAGGRAYYVGGFVRDKLMGKENKDIDMEIHGLIPKALEDILDSIGKRITIGESFGIYSIKGYGVDIALPRKEKLRGKGHRDFDVFVDAHIGTYKAAQRRDFTVNALMEDILSGEIIDHFGGKQDLENKVLRHVSTQTFPEDALRVLRGAQFAARFSFSIADETIELCRKTDLSLLTKERVFAELEKALIKAEKPSVFFEELRKMGQLSVWFSELENLINVPQNKIYHAEGDVWKHTMMVIDEAAKLRDKVSDSLSFMLLSVVHDFGKAVCTKEIDGVIHSYNHENEGLSLIKVFVERLTTEVNLKKYILNMSRLHMKPNILANAKAGIKSTNKMFDEAVFPKDLIYFSMADSMGRIKKDGENENKNSEFLFERLKIFEEIMAKPYVMGKDLINAGLKPGEIFSEALSFAHKLRLSGIEKENALKQVLGNIKSFEKKERRKDVF